MLTKKPIKNKRIQGLKNIKRYGKVTYVVVPVKRRRRKMNDFQMFLAQNSNTIRSIISKNPTVITKDDEWRKENEWDDIYEEIKK
jgi:hypothetical protein